MGGTESDSGRTVRQDDVGLNTKRHQQPGFEALEPRSKELSNPTLDGPRIPVFEYRTERETDSSAADQRSLDSPDLAEVGSLSQLNQSPGHSLSHSVDGVLSLSRTFTSVT